MSGVTGRSVKMAFAKTVTNSWGVAASVTKGVYFKSDAGIDYNPEVIEDRSFGNLFIGPSARGNTQPLDITLEGQSRYEDNIYIWDAMAMGSPSAVTISTSASGQVTSWLHLYDLANNTDGLALTLAEDKINYTEEVTSAKIYGWLEKNDGGVMTTAYKLLGNTATITSSININSTVAGATFPALGNWCLKKEGVFRMNAQGGGALGSTDDIKPETVEFEWMRPQDQSFSFGSAQIIEPADNEFPTFTIKAGFPRMNTVSANSLRIAIGSNTAYKADWVFSGALINSTDAWTKKYQFPYLETIDYTNDVAGAGQVKPQVTLVGRLPSAAPTGMSGVTKPFRLTRIMQNSVIAF